jgi:hypothetical protein
MGLLRHHLPKLLEAYSRKDPTPQSGTYTITFFYLLQNGEHPHHHPTKS